MDLSKMQEKHYLEECDVCHFGKYDVPESAQEWHLVCNECSAVLLCYDPLPHQQAFHSDFHKYKLFAGGFGSGKTTTACMETIDHIISTPNGTTLIGASTQPQLEQTAQKEFFEIFPREWITSYNKQKNYLDTVNGHRVIFRPLDEEQKARSLNLTFFWIEEANGIKFEYFTQLQTRLRNTAADKQRGILSSNPDMNWIKSEILLKSDKIFNSDVNYKQGQTEENPNISTHVAPTHLNTHLPPNYFEDTAQGKPEWWKRRYLHGSFENKEGLVYPNHQENIVEPFDIPAHWKRRVGGDFGLSNPTAFVLLATDPEDGTTYIYDEYKQEQQTVEYHANRLHEMIDGLPFNIIEAMIGDAAGQQKTAQDPSSVFDHYAEYNIFWEPSTKKLMDSIMKVYGYFEMGKLKVFNTCTETINELSEYRYPERSIDKDVKDEDMYEKPIAVNDHILDGLRYVVHEMPDDPNDLINKSYNAQFLVYNNNRVKKNIPPELQTDRKPQEAASWMDYY